ncbi:MAG: glycosyltransferase family 4 protein [Pseudonocardiaceae bacterium]
MRIAVVGPSHPYKGGIAQYTTELAHQLVVAGHEVRIESWSYQYPALLYPGQLTVREPELPPFTPTHRRLSWRRPDSWYASGRRLRDADLVVLVMVHPIQLPAYLGVLAGLGRWRRQRPGAVAPGVVAPCVVAPCVVAPCVVAPGVVAPGVVAQCHNVLPHERRAVDAALVRAVLSRVDGVLAHSAAQGEVARSLTDRPVTVEHMAPLVVARADAAGADAAGAGAEAPAVHRRLLSFGIVRRYKGLDVLLRALAAGPEGVRLRVAGEFWGGPEATERLVAELGLADRVELRPGYVEAVEVPGLFADVDALTLPYRTATASLNTFLAFEHGVPVIATRVGTVEQDVQDGVNGVLCAPDDVAALTAALHRFYADGEPQRLRAGVARVDAGPAWQRYCAALCALTPAPTRR